MNSPFLGLFESYLFITYIILIYKLLDWYGDAWILTDRGIIDVTWSLFMRKTVFIEYDDISGIESDQYTLFDKFFHIGDVTLHKHGEELEIRRMYRPEAIIAAVQANLHDHPAHGNGTAAQPDMHIYLDGFRHSAQPIPYKNGYRYAAPTPDDEQYIQKIRQKTDTIDLSGSLDIRESSSSKTKEDHSGHHGHDSGQGH